MEIQKLSLKEGVILPWNKNNQFYKDLLVEVAKHCNVKLDTPWHEIDEEKKKNNFGDNKNLSFYNSYNGWSYSENYNGVIGFLEKKIKEV